MSAPDGFPKAAAAVLALMRAGDWSRAEAAAADAEQRFPASWDVITLWRIQCLSGSGDGAGALALVRSVLARGGWYAPDRLMDNDDLAALRAEPGFDEALAVCASRRAAATASSVPALMLARPAQPEPWPALLVLHGNDSNATEALPSWRASVEAGWLLAAAQSATPVGPGRFAWSAATTGEIVRHVSFLQAGVSTGEPIVLGGFGRGGYHALRLAISGYVHAHAVIVVAPAMSNIEEIEPSIPDAARRGLRVWFFAGEHDRRAAKSSRLVGGQLQAAGIETVIDVRPDMAHEFPSDFEIVLPSVLLAAQEGSAQDR